MTRQKPFGLIGSITSDTIVSESGAVYRGLGGILYQTAALCGLGESVILFARKSPEILSDIEKLSSEWGLLLPGSVPPVPNPPNRVELFYSKRGERREILRSAVPPVVSEEVIGTAGETGMLILALNSGFDISLPDWRKIVDVSRVPVWLDVHSLALDSVLNEPRRYRPLPEWIEWARGASYLQANLQELASMMGHPGRPPTAREASEFAAKVLEQGLSAVFITLGRRGAIVAAGRGPVKISPPGSRRVLDSTGCGDVFCAGTASGISRGASSYEAAEFGVALAAAATSVQGIEETFRLAKACREAG
jgi:hypothetical protein